MEHNDAPPHDYYQHHMHPSHHEQVNGDRVPNNLSRRPERSSDSTPVDPSGTGRSNHIAASSLFANASSGLTGSHQRELATYWQKTITDIETQDHDFKSHALPLARIKKVMKADEDVKMISAEAPILFAKGCEIFITELTMRAWIHAHDSKRRTLARSDIANAISRSDMFDFLIDIVPREEFVTGATGGEGTDATPVAGAAGGFIGMPLGHAGMPVQPPQSHMQQQLHPMSDARAVSGESKYYPQAPLKHEESRSSSGSTSYQQQHHAGQMFDHSRYSIPPSPIASLPNHQASYLDHNPYSQSYGTATSLPLSGPGVRPLPHPQLGFSYDSSYTAHIPTHGELPHVLPSIHTQHHMQQQQHQHHHQRQSQAQAQQQQQQQHHHHHPHHQQQHGRQAGDEVMQSGYGSR